MTTRRWLLGLCWLCRREESVAFIGPLTVNGVTAPGYACQGCCDWSREYVAAWTQQHDARAAS